jgi:hypothetical protein
MYVYNIDKTMIEKKYKFHHHLANSLFIDFA